jgi:hypothetical protein
MYACAQSIDYMLKERRFTDGDTLFADDYSRKNGPSCEKVVADRLCDAEESDSIEKIEKPHGGSCVGGI